MKIDIRLICQPNGNYYGSRFLKVVFICLNLFEENSFYFAEVVQSKLEKSLRCLLCDNFDLTDQVCPPISLLDHFVYT